MEFLKILADIRTPFGEQFFQFVTYFGQEILLLGIICILYWCVNKQIAYQTGLSFMISGLCMQNLKITFRVPRPWVLDPGFKAVESAVPAATGFSFPSGHTQSATSVYSTFAFSAKKIWLKVLFVLLFLGVGFSRMYLGVHTPKDVLTGIALALVISCLVQRFIPKLKGTKKENAIVSLLLFIISVASILYAYILFHQGIIEQHFAADCFKAAGASLAFAVGWYVERTYIRFETAASMRGQILKFVIGIAVTVVLKIGLKALLGTGLIAYLAQYFLVVTWIVTIYPMFFKKFTK